MGEQQGIDLADGDTELVQPDRRPAACVNQKLREPAQVQRGGRP